MTACPICGQKNSKQASRCVSCGADFLDPDVRALMDAGAAPDPSVLEGAETLAASKVLGVRADRLDDGRALTGLGLIGAGLAAAGFFVPVSPGFEGYRQAWEVADAPLGMWVPLLAVVVGIAVAAAPTRRVLLRAAALAAIGIVGLVATPALGVFGAAARTGLPIEALGLVLCAAAGIERLYSPHSTRARFALIAGAVVVVAGLLVPVSDAGRLLPAELRFVSEDPTGHAVPLLLFWSRKAQGHMTFFVALFAVIPVVLAPAAAALAYPRPKVWDQTGLALRPLVWLLTLYAPLSMALLIFNLMGWDVRGVLYDGVYTLGDTFVEVATAGRAKIMLLSAAYATWAAFGTVACYRAYSAMRSNTQRS